MITAADLLWSACHIARTGKQKRKADKKMPGETGRNHRAELSQY